MTSEQIRRNVKRNMNDSVRRIYAETYHLHLNGRASTVDALSNLPTYIRNKLGVKTGDPVAFLLDRLAKYIDSIQQGEEYVP